MPLISLVFLLQWANNQPLFGTTRVIFFSSPDPLPLLTLSANWLPVALSSLVLNNSVSTNKNSIAMTNITNAVNSKNAMAPTGAANAVRIHPNDRKISAKSSEASNVVLMPHLLRLQYFGTFKFSVDVRLFNIWCSLSSASVKYGWNVTVKQKNNEFVSAKHIPASNFCVVKNKPGKETIILRAKTDVNSHQPYAKWYLWKSQW